MRAHGFCLAGPGFAGLFKDLGALLVLGELAGFRAAAGAIGGGPDKFCGGRKIGADLFAGNHVRQSLAIATELLIFIGVTWTKKADLFLRRRRALL